MTDAGGTTPYYYAEIANATTTATIGSAATRNGAIYMQTVATPNSLPVAFTNIYSFDNRVIGILGSTIYFSLKTDVNIFDLERFVSENFRVAPYTILSAFSVGTDLYFNTKNGILRLPNADFSARFEHVEKRLYIRYPKTTVEYNGVAWGLTNDGYRYFNGTNFSPDLSKDIKPDIDKAIDKIARIFDWHLSKRELSRQPRFARKIFCLDDCHLRPLPGRK
jgi:hypothetical protein